MVQAVWLFGREKAPKEAAKYTQEPGQSDSEKNPQRGTGRSRTQLVRWLVRWNVILLLVVSQLSDNVIGCVESNNQSRSAESLPWKGKNELHKTPCINNYYYISWKLRYYNDLYTNLDGMLNLNWSHTKQLPWTL